MSEVQLTTESIRRFRQALCRGTSARRRATTRSTRPSAKAARYPGLEHWLPLFHEQLDTLLDYVPGIPVVLRRRCRRCGGASVSRRSQDYYDARREAHRRRTSPASRPISRCRRTRSISSREEWSERTATLAARAPDALRAPRIARAASSSIARRGQGRNFAAERADENANVFEAADRAISATCRQPGSA